MHGVGHKRKWLQKILAPLSSNLQALLVENHEQCSTQLENQMRQAIDHDRRAAKRGRILRPLLLNTSFAFRHRCHKARC